MNERLAALANAARDDQAFRDALQHATSPEEIVRLAGQKGIPVTVDDLSGTGNADVTDPELETAAGGRTGLTLAAAHCSTLVDPGCLYDTTNPLFCQP